MEREENMEVTSAVFEPAFQASGRERGIREVACHALSQRVRYVAIKRFGVSPEEVDDLWKELMKYFALHLKYGNLPMTSAKVDAVWHSFILNLGEYLGFCRKVGTVIMHLPNTE